MGYWKSLLPKNIWNPLNEFRRDYFPNRVTSYSGEGEDLVLAKIFGGKRNGFYIDIGCYHPKVNSNTYYFYRQGWSGINIDANPDSIAKFNKIRKRDINVNAGISLERGALTYYQFSEPAINTFSKDLYEERLRIPWVEFIGTASVDTTPLRDVLSLLTVPAEIDFMDIDVEGLDMDVLRSNDWNRYRPNVVMIEDQNTEQASFESLESFRYLTPLGYRLTAKTFSTLIFVHEKHLKSIL
jgi:FkbM family methyltransferase